jgi:hypothetical protein
MSKMEAIASPQGMKPWVQQMVTNSEWMDGFDSHTSRHNKVIILTATRPFDGKKVDVFGIMPKEALKPFGLDIDFNGRPAPPHKLTTHIAMGLMLRAVVIPHEQETMMSGRDPNKYEVDYCDFIAGANGVKDFVHKTLVHQRHTQKFGEQIVNFLAKGVRPIILMS